MHVRASGHIIEQYFNEVISKEVIDSVHTLELVGMFLGRSKEQMQWILLCHWIWLYSRLGAFCDTT